MKGESRRRHGKQETRSHKNQGSNLSHAECCWLLLLCHCEVILVTSIAPRLCKGGLRWRYEAVVTGNCYSSECHLLSSLCTDDNFPSQPHVCKSKKRGYRSSMMLHPRGTPGGIQVGWLGAKWMLMSAWEASMPTSVCRY